MSRYLRFLLAFSLLAVPQAWGQIVYISSHSPWLTQRNDSIIVKAQLDTTVLKKKRIKLDLTRYEGARKKLLTSKVFQIQDYSQDFNLGVIGTTLLGGRDFLKVTWSIVDTTEKGEISPIGIVNIDKIPATDTLRSRMVKSIGGLKQIASLVKPEDFQKIGDFQAAPLWDSTGLYLVCSKPQGGQALTFVVDAKNAKSAYLAYADRFMTYKPVSDSLETVRYKRSITADSIVYTLTGWDHEITSAVSGDYFVIHVPWYDMGMVPPFVGRQVGFSMFALGANNAAAAVPATARRELPGSWGNLKFVQ